MQKNTNNANARKNRVVILSNAKQRPRQVPVQGTEDLEECPVSPHSNTLKHNVGAVVCVKLLRDSETEACSPDSGQVPDDAMSLVSIRRTTRHETPFFSNRTSDICDLLSWNHDFSFSFPWYRVYSRFSQHSRRSNAIRQLRRATIAATLNFLPVIRVDPTTEAAMIRHGRCIHFSPVAL